jgi:hypothetical protein
MNANSSGLKLALSKHRSAVIRFRRGYSAIIDRLYGDFEGRAAATICELFI